MNKKKEQLISTTTPIHKTYQTHLRRWAKKWGVSLTIAVHMLIDKELKREERNRTLRAKKA